uniref:SLL1a n=1 Tax=Brassica napus TaxID=3708 RepID=Q96345_BRANA|nr:SLL1a [Brassica napus]
MEGVHKGPRYSDDPDSVQ